MTRLFAQGAAARTSEGTSEIRWLGDRRRCVIADCLLLGLAVLAVGASAAGGHSVIRLSLVLAATCLLPGSAILTRLPGEDVLEVLGLAVGLSFTVGAAGALAMVWTGWWHPYGCALALVSTACVMIVLDFRRNLRETLAPWRVSSPDAGGEGL
jgi:uncharacterized membrane protein